MSEPTGSSPELIFRAPTTSPASTTNNTTSFAPPALTFLTGAWHVTHSSLPMWKSNRNVVITYTPLESPPGSIDDLVTYQPLSSSTLKTVRGIDTPDPVASASYHWRGKGWLRIASSHWEVLGWGEDEGGWVVTFFRKTLFTPAGVDFYSRTKEGLSDELLAKLKAKLREVGEGDEAMKGLLDGLFVVKQD